MSRSEIGIQDVECEADRQIEVGCLGCTGILSDLEVHELDENDCAGVLPKSPDNHVDLDVEP